MNSKEIRVVILEASKNLEEKINKWLSDNDVEIIDIKYQAFTWDDWDTYSALIIYKIK